MFTPPYIILLTRTFLTLEGIASQVAAGADVPATRVEEPLGPSPDLLNGSASGIGASPDGLMGAMGMAASPIDSPCCRCCALPPPRAS